MKLSKQQWKEKREGLIEEFLYPLGNVNSAFAMKFAYYNLRFARGSLKWLRNSKCCKANFSVVIDNTNNFGEPPAELYDVNLTDSISFYLNF